MRMNEKELTVMRQQPALFVPVGEYTKPGTLSGLLLPTGESIMELNGVSGLAFSLYRKQLEAEPLIIKGTWIFVPEETRKIKS